MHTTEQTNDATTTTKPRPNYIVFAGFEEGPRGGWIDFYESASTLSDAKELCNRAIQADATWTQIVCVNTMTVVQSQTIIDYTKPFVSVYHEDEYYN